MHNVFAKLTGLLTLTRILFRSQNLSEVKEYCQEQWSKIVQGRVPIHELTFAKEVKLGTYRSGSRN